MNEPNDSPRPQDGVPADIGGKIDALTALVQTLRKTQMEHDRTLISQSTKLDQTEEWARAELIRSAGFEDKIDRLSVKVENLDTTVTQLLTTLTERPSA